MLSRTVVFGCVCALATAVVAQPTSQNRPGRNASADASEYAPRTVVRNPIRPIVDPRIVPASQADVFDGELVIGVEVNGQARAYPINQLTGPQREIINDELGGKVIAATW